MHDRTAPHLPGWVPEGARRYLAHTEAGKAIRELARKDGCHASTVMRQIRRMELRRDDPLVDAALTSLAEMHFDPAGQSAGCGPDRGAIPRAKDIRGAEQSAVEAAAIEREARTVLRHLAETGAVLAVAENLPKAVVVRDNGAGGSTTIAVVDRPVAEAMALNDWIACGSPGKVSRYRITPTGRSMLGRLLAEAENRARSTAESGFSERQSPFFGSDTSVTAEPCGDADGRQRQRFSMAESPLTLLSRRRDRDGEPFLDETLVRAGERLREDFELAQMATGPAQAGSRASAGHWPGRANPPEAARHRVEQALADLGPGLSDVALRCCCHLEGLEQAERRMGWSARSGKIVLRIALQRLRRHYDAAAPGDDLIG